MDTHMQRHTHGHTFTLTQILTGTHSHVDIWIYMDSGEKKHLLVFVFLPSALSQDEQDDAQLKIEDILQMVSIHVLI